MCFIVFFAFKKKEEDDEGINVLYKNAHNHSTLDREATVVIAAQSIRRRRRQRRNNQIYNQSIWAIKDE